MSRKLKRRAYESLEQFEQDFRRALFNHTKCSGVRKVMCGRGQEKQTHLQKRFSAAILF